MVQKRFAGLIGGRGGRRPGAGRKPDPTKAACRECGRRSRWVALGALARKAEVPDQHLTATPKNTCLRCAVKGAPRVALRTYACDGCGMRLLRSDALLPNGSLLKRCERCRDKATGRPCSRLGCTRRAIRRNTCSRHTARASTYKPRARVERSCARCKAPFLGTLNHRYCEGCRPLAHADTLSQNRHRRRAAIRNNGVRERVYPSLVFEAAAWRCRACRCETPRELRGTNDKRAPELDHVVPLARGGEHSYRNVQLLCRGCNIRKRDRLEVMDAAIGA